MQIQILENVIKKVVSREKIVLPLPSIMLGCPKSFSYFIR